jgi:transposase
MLDKDTIEKEILPFLSKGKSGKAPEDLVGIVQCILKRLKTGCQWSELYVQEFIKTQYTYGAVYHHFNKWSKDGSWLNVWKSLLEKYKKYLDLSNINLDGSLTTCWQGGEQTEYQGRRKEEACNMLYFTDSQGIPIAFTEVISGEHHDLYKIKDFFEQLCQMLISSGIDVKGLFMNADAGFDSKELRDICYEKDIIPNIPENPRNEQNTSQTDADIWTEKPEEIPYFDEELYKNRSICERGFAWIDGFRAARFRFEKLAITFFAIICLTIISIFIRHIKKITQF